MKTTSSSVLLGHVQGIPIKIHWSFLLILGYVAFINVRAGADTPQVIWALVFVLAIFACVVLHELGHAHTALYYGIHTRSITLYPIGGIAALEKIPEKPIQELAVTLAGPLVNVVLGILFWLLASWLTPQGIDLENASLTISPSTFLINLAAVNLLLAVFNLIPAFPMDGGRVLRSVLAMAIGRLKATQIAMIVGQILAVIFIFKGFMGNPFLILIGAFVFFGAAQEYNSVRYTSVLSLHQVRDALMTRFTLLSLDTTLAQVRELILSGAEKEFVVVDHTGRPVGIFTRDLLIAHLSNQPEDTTVGQCYKPSDLTLSPDQSMEEAYRLMHEHQIPIAPVLENNTITAVINTENIMEYLMLTEGGEE
ncbi:site-2 protease family protein [Schleiferia thermophila]|uniref:site-2 protease family protein n=1 Tax=Schleiferia thermophila TaxID=884107 RepID=UPI003EEDE38E